MHQYTWFMLLGLTLAGGMIAFMGDRLGRYMGKRRLTVCGLRPRHTALCFTVIAGMLISVMSLVAMALLSVHVRTALFEVADLQQERAKLGHERDRLEEQNRRLVSESNRLRSDYETSKERAQRAAAEEKRSRQQLAETLKRLEETRAQAERRVATLQREVAERSRLASEKTEEIARLGQQIREARAGLNQASERLKDAQDRYHVAKARYEEVAARHAKVSSRFSEVTEELTEAQGSLRATRDQLNLLMGQVEELMGHVKASREQIRSLEQAKASLEQSRDALREQVASLSQQRDELMRTVEAARKVNHDLVQSYDSQRRSTVVFAVGEELAWAVVDGREPRAHIRARLEEIVEKAREVAASRGAGIKSKPEMALLLVRVVAPADGGKHRAQQVFFGMDALDAVTEEISRANTGVVALLRVASNTVAGEPVLAEVQLWQNRLVFHEGEPIARREMNGRQQTGALVEELVAMLQTEVRATAIARGMIPRDATPGVVERPRVGEVPLAELVAVAEQVRRHRGMAIVEAISAADLWTADTVRVSFRVTPRPAETTPRKGGSVLTVQ